MKAPTSIDEKKLTAANYIISFYQEVGNLTYWYANYENVLLEMKEKYGHEGTNKLTPEEKDNLMKYCQSLRYYVIKCNISYKSIAEGATITKDDKIETLCNAIKEQYIVRAKDLSEYVTILNKHLVTSVMKNLLESSQDIVNEVYSTTNTNQDEQPRE